MGCASSSEAPRAPPTKKAEERRASSRTQTSTQPANEADIGLRDMFEYVKPLGQGGTGQTLLYRNKATGENVAIKLIKRPIPKVIIPNILREIMVRFDLSS